MRLLPKADLAVHLPHLSRLHLHGHLDRAHITRLLDDFVDGEHAVRMRVADGGAANGKATGGGLNGGGGGDQALFQRQRRDERLHGGAGLKGVGQRPVAQLRAAQILPLGGRVAGVVDQRQHFAALGVQHHHAARLSLVLQHRIAQLLIGEKLHLAVNAELQVAPIDRGHFLAHRFHHIAQAIFDDPARARATGQVFVEGELDAFLAVVLHIRKTHHMGSGFALGVLTLVLFALVHAAHAQGGNVLRHRLVHLTLEPNKGFVFVLDFFVQLGQRHLQQLRQAFEFGRLAFDVLRDGPDAGGRHARCEDQAVAVQNAAPVGGQLQRTGKTHFALALKKIIRQHLDVGRTRSQRAKGQGDGQHDQLAAPQRCRAGQQGAGGVEDAAAAHGAAPAGALRFT